MFLSEKVQRYLRATGPSPDDVQTEMTAYAAEHGFPIIGPDAGGVLRSLACATQAKRVFEFGSGFGYSASWFLRGLPEDGEVVLTEFDADELELAEEFLTRAGLADRAVFEHGDAMEVVAAYDGPFDIVLFDHQKDRYADAFAAVRDRLPVGAVVVADNVMQGPFSLDDLLAYVESDTARPADSNTRGIIDYLETVRTDADFHTVVLPVGNGLALTTRERISDSDE
jgi:caffeoyl-CoA O-methyltransferase